MTTELDVETLQRVVKALEAKGIGFTVDDYISLSGDDIPEFLSDPELFIANANGVDKEDYIAFKNDVPLRCAGTTRKGRQCKHPVNGGGGQVDMRTYAKLLGGYCAIHGG